MNRINLIERGYFAKELPPCFTTKKFAAEFDVIMHDAETKHEGCLNKLLSDIEGRTDLTSAQKAEEKVRIKTDFQNKLKYSACTIYNIPKVGLSRKEIKIPNPFHQGKLVIVIEKYFSDIQNVYNTSPISVTKPIEEIDKSQGKRAITHSTYGEFKEKCILSSYYQHLQLKTDISKFYHSIYTHAVPWTTEGKPFYKKNRALSDRDPLKKKGIYGDDIDICLRNCQSQQTKGIPIGPDTSLIVAEIIGCHVDSLFHAKLKKKHIDYVGFRYYDDYFLYFNNELEAEIAIDILEKILADFELELNHDKTVLQANPITIEQEWAIKLKSYFFRPTIEEQKEDIWNYFALAFRYAGEYSQDSVLKFALNKFFFVRIEQENWDVFEPLLLRVGLAETATLQLIAKILVTYKSLVRKQKVKNFAFELIKRHYQKSHDYELTWALWILKEFNIPVRKDILELVFQTNSVTALLIGLDLLQAKKTKIDTQSAIEKVLEENLTTQYWLLAYEVAIKGWLPSVSTQTIEGNFFFNLLKEKSVSFYDGRETLEPIKVQRSLFKQILKKISQVERALRELKATDQKISKEVNTVIKLLDIDYKKQALAQEEIQDRLSQSEELISNLVVQLKNIQQEQLTFGDKRIYWILEKRLDELQDLATRELTKESKPATKLLFDPTYV